MKLFKRANSKYYWFKFTFDGNLIQKSTQVTNRKDAETIASAFRTQLALGKIGIKQKRDVPTFEAATCDFLKWRETKHAHKPNSFERISYSCVSLKKYFGKTRVDRIEQTDVENFIVWRSSHISRKTKKPISRDTINLELTALKSIFKRLISLSIVASSPTSEVKQLTENERKFYVLSGDDETRYLFACPQPLRDVASLMLETGMRPTEVYNLARENVLLEKGYLQVRDGKTKSSNRKVWLSDKAKKILHSRFEKFSGVYLFPKKDKDGEKPTRCLHYQHQSTLKRIGLKFRLYDCRHTFATRILETGIDILTLASLLGHSNLDEVARYAHPSETRKSDAVQQMQKQFRKVS